MKTETTYYQRPGTHDPLIFRHSPPDRVRKIAELAENMTFDKDGEKVNVKMLSSSRFYNACKKTGVLPANARRIFKGVV
jgi:hypothetical protein